MILLEAIHWRLSLAFAIKLFYTPVKFPIPKREIEIRNSATCVDIPLNKGRHGRLFKWGTGEKKVILMHGWSGRASQFFRLTESLLEESYTVFAVEAPAHGDSSYKQSHMLEFIECIEWVYKEYGPIDFAIGHSLGGMAMLNVHARLDEAFKKIVTIGTPAGVREVVEDFCNVLHARPRTAEGIIDKIHRRFSLSVEEVSSTTLAKKWNPRGMILQDEMDMDVGMEQARTLSEAWTNAELVVTTGLGHRKILSHPSVHKRIIDFFSS